jgi:hypothetical protein
VVCVLLVLLCVSDLAASCKRSEVSGVERAAVAARLLLRCVMLAAGCCRVLRVCDGLVVVF